MQKPGSILGTDMSRYDEPGSCKVLCRVDRQDLKISSRHHKDARTIAKGRGAALLVDAMYHQIEKIEQYEPKHCHFDVDIKLLRRDSRAKAWTRRWPKEERYENPEPWTMRAAAALGLSSAEHAVDLRCIAPF